MGLTKKLFSLEVQGRYLPIPAMREEKRPFGLIDEKRSLSNYTVKLVTLSREDSLIAYFTLQCEQDC